MPTRLQVLIPIGIAAIIVGIAGVVSMPSEVKLEQVDFPIGTIKLDDKFSPAGKSKKRREYFDSMQHALEYFKNKELFSNFNPKVFNDYLEHGLVEVKNGFKLVIPVENEVAIFRNFQINYPSKIFNVNGILVYGAKNSIYWKSDLKWINCNFKNINLIAFPGSHLFPLENPESTAMLIKRYV